MEGIPGKGQIGLISSVYATLRNMLCMATGYLNCKYRSDYAATMTRTFWSQLKEHYRKLPILTPPIPDLAIFCRRIAALCDAKIHLGSTYFAHEPFTQQNASPQQKTAHKSTIHYLVPGYCLSIETVKEEN